MWKCVTLLLLMYVRGSLPLEKICGRPSLNPRIVGGMDARLGQWPWMASLHEKGIHVCGGSLINNEWVLTAAHCINDTDKSEILVYLGKRKQERGSPFEIERTVKDIISHSSYDNITFENDIALLHLSSAVTFTNYIKPICLADEKSNFPPGITGWVTGWGVIGVKFIAGKQSTVSVPLRGLGTLQEVRVPVYKDEDCRKRCRGTFTSNMICIGTAEGGKGPFRGDSGGPLMSQLCSVWVQSGVVSHGYGCAQPNVPAVFTRVSMYKKWITNNVGGNLPGFILFEPPDKCSSESKTSTSCNGRCNEKYNLNYRCSCNVACNKNCCNDYKERCSS